MERRNSCWACEQSSLQMRQAAYDERSIRVCMNPLPAAASTLPQLLDRGRVLL